MHHKLSIFCLSISSVVLIVSPDLLTCPKNITELISSEAKEKTAVISLPTPSGGPVNTSLPAGEYDFFYKRADGAECYYTASVKGIR